MSHAQQPKAARQYWSWRRDVLRVSKQSKNNWQLAGPVNRADGIAEVEHLTKNQEVQSLSLIRIGLTFTFWPRKLYEFCAFLAKLDSEEASDGAPPGLARRLKSKVEVVRSNATTRSSDKWHLFHALARLTTDPSVTCSINRWRRDGKPFHA